MIEVPALLTSGRAAQIVPPPHCVNTNFPETHCANDPFTQAWESGVHVDLRIDDVMVHSGRVLDVSQCTYDGVRVANC